MLHELLLYHANYAQTLLFKLKIKIFSGVLILLPAKPLRRAARRAVRRRLNFEEMNATFIVRSACLGKANKNHKLSSLTKGIFLFQNPDCPTSIVIRNGSQQYGASAKTKRDGCVAVNLDLVPIQVKI